MPWRTKISSGYQSWKKFLLPFFFFFRLSPVMTHCCVSLFLGRWLHVPKLVVVLGCRAACDELNLQNSLVATHDVRGQVPIAACSICLSPMSLKASGVNAINLIHDHRSFPAGFGSPVQGRCDWRWGSPVELIVVGKEWEFPARLC